MKREGDKRREKEDKKRGWSTSRVIRTRGGFKK